jgi:hypothetical protein
VPPLDIGGMQLQSPAVAKRGDDRLAAFHAVLALVVGAAQAELAGPFTRARDAGDAAARIGSTAGEAHPHVEALSHVARAVSLEADFARGLRMLLDGIAARGRKRRRD